MSLRWRKTGEILCAAKSEAMENDTYINDRLHYQLSVIQKIVIPDSGEDTNGLWHWLHGEGEEYGAMPQHFLPSSPMSTNPDVSSA